MSCPLLLYGMDEWAVYLYTPRRSHITNFSSRPSGFENFLCCNFIGWCRDHFYVHLVLPLCRRLCVCGCFCGSPGKCVSVRGDEYTLAIKSGYLRKNGYMCKNWHLHQILFYLNFKEFILLIYEIINLILINECVLVPKCMLVQNVREHILASMHWLMGALFGGWHVLFGPDLDTSQCTFLVPRNPQTLTLLFTGQLEVQCTYIESLVSLDDQCSLTWVFLTIPWYSSTPLTFKLSCR